MRTQLTIAANLEPTCKSETNMRLERLLSRNRWNPRPEPYYGVGASLRKKESRRFARLTSPITGAAKPNLKWQPGDGLVCTWSFRHDWHSTNERKTFDIRRGSSWPTNEVPALEDRSAVATIRHSDRLRSALGADGADLLVSAWRSSRQLAPTSLSATTGFFVSPSTTGSFGWHPIPRHAL